MQISSMPESIASSAMIWITGLVRPSRSTMGNISFCTAVEAGYWRVPWPAAVITALRTLAMSIDEAVRLRRLPLTLTLSPEYGGEGIRRSRGGHGIAGDGGRFGIS